MEENEHSESIWEVEVWWGILVVGCTFKDQSRMYIGKHCLVYLCLVTLDLWSVWCVKGHTQCCLYI